ncbi:MAG: FG-GAP repeat protein [Planctomycetes bacterium]|nr:FG-GAP repeat protein [Planctomycetota bacterium]
MLSRTLFAVGCIAASSVPAFAQCDVQKVVDPIGGFAEHFGDRFALVGDELFVGAPNHDGPFGSQQGAVLLHRKVAGTWTLVETIHANTNTSLSQFGYGVAVAGDHLLVGAYADNEAATLAGAVHAFERTLGGFVPIQKLIGSTAGSFQYAGHAVAADRDWLVVGAADLSGITDVGRAFVFRFEGNAWVEKQVLVPSDPAVARRFGFSASIDDDRLVIGCPAWGVPNSVGAAYVFEFDGTTWNQTAQLVAQDAGSYDVFGVSVAISGDRILCGATGNDENGVQSGAVYVFERVGAAWQQTTKLVASDAQQGDLFGTSVALQGDVAVIGAGWVDDLGHQSGAGYVFTADVGGWRQTQRLTAPDPIPDHQFGHWVALDGGTVAVSAYRDATFGTQSGADYVFELGGEATPYCVSEPNSTGLPAKLSYSGSLAIDAGTFTLHADNLPPNKQGIFFYSANPLQTPFGNGWLCVSPAGTGIFRLTPAAAADANGHLARTVDFTVAPAGSGPGAITPGSTWHFQCWYRDPGAGAGFDLSDGLRAVFCP